LKYAYEDLSPEQFEDLVIFLCQELLGIAVQGFSKGPDGGRDARFEGTAQLFPSTAEPWVGKVVIQAKHTNGYNKKFSESDFFSKGKKGTIIEKEIPRIKKLRKAKSLDHYMLFANRDSVGMQRRKSENIFRVNAASLLPRFTFAMWSNWRAGLRRFLQYRKKPTLISWIRR
jgi:hypothetical protein